MKRIFLISLLFSLAGYCLAQEGTNFEDLTFKEALAKSQAQGKSYSSIATRKPAGHASTW